jgi:MFS transporter, ACS family, allantoate permease
MAALAKNPSSLVAPYLEKHAVPERYIDTHIIEHSHDADEAMKAFEGREGQEIEIDAETNRRLLRIIDWHMMPLMCLVYGMNYLDSKIRIKLKHVKCGSQLTLRFAEIALSYVSIMGFQQDIGLTGDNYQWLGSLFYFGEPTLTRGASLSGQADKM